MQRLLWVLLILGGMTQPVEAVTVPAAVSLLRLDEQTVRLYVGNVGVYTNQNLYQLFNVPTVSPFGDPVYVGPYGNPWSIVLGGFGVPTGFVGDVHPLGPGEVLAFGLDYSIDVLAPPWTGYVGLDLHAAQDYFYEYPLPDGKVFRDVAGELEGDLHVAGYVPASVGERIELVPTPEPRTLSLLASGLVCLCLVGGLRPRRSTA